MINGNTSSIDSIEYFAKREWRENNIVDDDKYWTDEDLMDNFIIFYCYVFAHLGLPSPTRMQLEIAHYVANRDNLHRLVWSPRRHS